MAKLTLSEWTIPAADLGPENPHAPLQLQYPNLAHYEGQEVWLDSTLPYRLQDGYNRELKPTKHKVAILESDRLKATFLLGLGGRLWSLIHKPSKRELLYVNPVIQPVNIGIRGAWFSGGMEWNMGLFGHCTFTCEPVFAAKTKAPDGGDGIRFWEYERYRRFPWQVDIWAPDGSDFLYVMPRLVNPHEETIPMYWWTCIAVPEIEEARVLAPAHEAFEPFHDGRYGYHIKDLSGEADLTYPTRREKPRDTYFDVPEGQRPWIAHVAPDGEGVLHLSSRMLKGRKQWVWGMGKGGRRWQDWLSPNGPPYIEIQGGLGKRQSEYVPMPPKADWSWLEAYGPVNGIEIGDWRSARDATNARIESLLPEAKFTEMEAAMSKAQRLPIEKQIYSGSGWGALEELRRKKSGVPPMGGPEIPFAPDSIREEESKWRTLIETRSLPSWNPQQEPGPYVGAEWRPLLQEGVREDAANALTWLHLGVAHFQAGDRFAARAAFEKSQAAQPNAWAIRNLAVMDQLEGDLPSAAKRMMTAFKMLGEEPCLVDEMLKLSLQAKTQEPLAELLNMLSSEAAACPRVRLASALLAIKNGDLVCAKEYFDEPCDLADIREGEESVTQLWRELCAQDPSIGDPEVLPAEYDFRMGVIPPKRERA